MRLFFMYRHYFKGTIGSTLLFMKDFISDLSDYNTLSLSFMYVLKEA